MKTISRNLAGCAAGDTLAVRLREARKHARLTIKDAAPKVGISAGQLGRIEQGGGLHGR